MNLFTTTNEHTLWVEDAQNNPVQVRFHLVQRWGATPEMIISTVKHFAFACAVLAAGMDWDHDNSKFQEYSDREIYQRLYNATHNEPCVQIFTNEFPIWKQQKLTRYSLSIMTEETSAFAIAMGFFEMDAAAIFVDEICNRLRPANTPQKRTQAPQTPATDKWVAIPVGDKGGELVVRDKRTINQQGQSELDKHFGPKKVPNDLYGPNTNVEAETVELPDGVVLDDNGAPVIVNWSYKLQDEYEQLFAGKSVAVRIGRVRRMLVDNREGTETYDTIQFHPYYNDEPDKERRCLRIYINERDNNYDWKTFKKQWEQYFAVVGADLQGEGIARFKLNKSGDRTYWNFQGLRFEDEIAPLEPAEASIEDIPDDIPF